MAHAVEADTPSKNLSTTSVAGGQALCSDPVAQRIRLEDVGGSGVDTHPLRLGCAHKQSIAGNGDGVTEIIVGETAIGLQHLPLNPLLAPQHVDENSA